MAKSEKYRSTVSDVLKALDALDCVEGAVVQVRIDWEGEGWGDAYLAVYVKLATALRPRRGAKAPLDAS